MMDGHQPLRPATHPAPGPTWCRCSHRPRTRHCESDPPFDDKRRFGHSRDKRPDCVRVVIALVVTPRGFPLAYEVMPGNTSDKTTLADFLAKIEAQYGRSDRVWIMDRGIPTEETLAAMRDGEGAGALIWSAPPRAV